MSLIIGRSTYETKKKQKTEKDIILLKSFILSPVPPCTMHITTGCTASRLFRISITNLCYTFLFYIISIKNFFTNSLRKYPCKIFLVLFFIIKAYIIGYIHFSSRVFISKKCKSYCTVCR